MQYKKILIGSMITVLFSCSSSSSFESDVKTLAKYQCQMKQLMAKDPSDTKAQEELSKVQKDAEDFAIRMREKYKDKQNDKDFAAKADKIMKEEMDNCK